MRRQIEAEDTPLGRVLIQNNVLRRVHLAGLWRVRRGRRVGPLFDIPPGESPTAGRPLIMCNNEPAVELLEIVTPELA